MYSISSMLDCTLICFVPQLSMYSYLGSQLHVLHLLSYFTGGIFSQALQQEELLELLLQLEPDLGLRQSELSNVPKPAHDTIHEHCESLMQAIQ